MTDDLIARVKALLAMPKPCPIYGLAEIVPELLAALKAKRAETFLLRAKLAELQAQLQIQESGLDQPPGRHVGDDL